LKLKCDDPLSNVAFNFNVRRYIQPLAEYYHSCTNGRLGDAANASGDAASGSGANPNPNPNPNPGITSELVVNVDNPDEAAAWLQAGPLAHGARRLLCSST
jgi:hypothetical protein